LAQAALKIIKRAGYSNAGTVEFILDDDRHFYFLEVNTRLQVEHPLPKCESVLISSGSRSGLAHGQPLSVGQEDIHFRGHAIECRFTRRILRTSIFHPADRSSPQPTGRPLDSGRIEGLRETIDPLDGKYSFSGSSA